MPSTSPQDHSKLLVLKVFMATGCILVFILMNKYRDGLNWNFTIKMAIKASIMKPVFKA